MGIVEEIAEAIKEENKGEVKESNYLKANTVTLPLEEYLRLYNSSEEYSKTLSLIFTSLKPSKYDKLGVCLKDDQKILEFIANNNPCIFKSVLEDILADDKEED